MVLLFLSDERIFKIYIRARVYRWEIYNYIGINTRDRFYKRAFYKGNSNNNSSNIYR